MRLSFIMILLAIGVVGGMARLCAKQSAVQINLAQYKLPRTNTYRFAIDMRKGHVEVEKSENGTAFIGNLSSLILKNQQGVEFVYDSEQFGFECPALHKPTKSNEELIQLQITYRFRIPQQSNNSSMKAPYEWVLFSFPFMVSEYVPENSLSINGLLNAVQAKEEIDLRNVVRQLVSAETLVYTTRDWRFGDRSVLRMIRKEIRLMSKEEFSKLKLLIEDDVQLQTNEVSVKNVVRKPQKIYQVKSYPFEESILFRKEDL